MSGTVSASLVLVTAAMIAGVLCMGPTAATAVFQPTLGIAARAEVAVVEQVNGRRRYYRSYGYPYAYYPSAWATTALRVPTRLSIQNTLVVCRFGVAGRTTRPIIDSREAIAPC